MKKIKEPLLPWVGREGMALCTDLYQLTMIAGYLKTGVHEKRSAFEYFFRELPSHAGFGVFAGLEQALSGLEKLRFSESDLEYLRESAGFDGEVIEFLSRFKPEVDVWAMEEGEVVFPGEPLLRVEGPLASAQLVETYLLNALNYPTLIATQAARICLAAEGDPVLEFGLRRAQGPDGGLSGSRAAYIGGCSGTSNVLAGKAYGIPVRGTHAHSWVMSHGSELEAFRAYARVFPNSSIMLVDTYDTLKSGVPNAIAAFKELRKNNPSVRAAIRLDSGDLARLSKEAHRMMSEAGFKDPMIVASNDLDADLIADLKRQGARINAWGVGTHLITSYDYPALGGVYKIVAVMEKGEWSPRLKIASTPEKTTDPDRKRVARLLDSSGHPLADVLYALDEDIPAGGTIHALDRMNPLHEYEFEAARVRPLLNKVMEGGKITAPMPSVEEIRDKAQASISSLIVEMKRLRNPERYAVALSPGLAELKKRLLRGEKDKARKNAGPGRA